MTIARLARRRFILTAIAASSVLTMPNRWLPGSSALADGAVARGDAQLVRLLFPHGGLATEVYAEIAETLFDSLATNPETAQLLDMAGSVLDDQVDGAWIDISEDRQAAALKAIESEVFFAAILAALRGAFYNHPKVWAHLDYPGSSREHGGYKHRGFDNIDWLPEVK